MRERRNARDETRRDARTSAVADMVDGVWGRVRDEKSAVFSKTINLHVRIHTNALYSTPPSLKRVVSLSLTYSPASPHPFSAVLSLAFEDARVSPCVSSRPAP